VTATVDFKNIPSWVRTAVDTNDKFKKLNVRRSTPQNGRAGSGPGDYNQWAYASTAALVEDFPLDCESARAGVGNPTPPPLSHVIPATTSPCYKEAAARGFAAASISRNS
jgi:hypothetical protein